MSDFKFGDVLISDHGLVGPHTTVLMFLREREPHANGARSADALVLHGDGAPINPWSTGEIQRITIPGSWLLDPSLRVP